MDFKECIKILNERGLKQSDNSNFQVPNNFTYCVPCDNQNLKGDKDKKTNTLRNNEVFNNISDKIDAMSNLDLLNLISSIQSERTMIYKEYYNCLQIIINKKKLSDYTHLCSEMTSSFTVLSEQIITIKNSFNTRGFNEISTVIESIQSTEKEKLLLNASLHLELLRDAFPEVQSVYGPSVDNQIKDLNKKIDILNEKLSNYLEEIQCFKCDLI